MELTLYQADAFTKEVFGGNPAAICPLDYWLDDDLLQKIANENNLSETAFFVKEKHGYHLRWFTPAVEVDLCGHATLAAAHILYEHLGFEAPNILFQTRSGQLTVEKTESGYLMNFPADHLTQTEFPIEFVDGLGIEQPLETLKGKDDFLVILDQQSAVEQLQPDFSAIAKLANARGVIVSAPGDAVDFVSRCFYPAAGINEDPVTGSAHTTMTPYWAKRLGKSDLIATQVSDRRGHLGCNLRGDRVELIGNAVTYMKATIFV